MKRFLFFSLWIMMSYAQGVSEYSFVAINVSHGFIIFEPFDVCGNTPFLLAPSTCSRFDAGMEMSGVMSHVKTLELRWRYWKSQEDYNNGEKGIACHQTVTLTPPCNNPEVYELLFCFNKTEVFMIYEIIWNGWKNSEFVLANGCPVNYFGDLVGELSFFEKNPDASNSSFFSAMQRKYDYDPERRVNSNYFWLKISPFKVIHYRKKDGKSVCWGDICKIGEEISRARILMRDGFSEVISKIANEPDITPEAFTSFVADLGKVKECFICNNLNLWKAACSIAISNKLINPGKPLWDKIDFPLQKNSAAMVTVTSTKTFVLNFENILFDNLELDAETLSKMRKRGYFERITITEARK